jgi:YHS domain-containing protein
MIRGLLFFLVIFVIYSAIKSVVRSAVKAYHEDEHKQGGRQIMGDEMVMDPECRTYVVKDRAVVRRIRGTLTYFCSDACAQRYEDKNRA